MPCTRRLHRNVLPATGRMEKDIPEGQGTNFGFGEKKRRTNVQRQQNQSTRRRTAHNRKRIPKIDYSRQRLCSRLPQQLRRKTNTPRMDGYSTRHDRSTIPRIHGRRTRVDKRQIQGNRMKQQGTPQTYLAKRILKEHKRTGFIGAIVYAPRGYGKSSFTLQTLFDLFYNGYGLNKERAWNEALNRTLFDLPEIVERLQTELNNDKPTQALIFDDSGVYFSGQAYGFRYKWHSLLKSFLDTLRLGTSAVLMTTPNTKDLASYVRRHDDYFVKILKRSSDFRRTARIYRQHTLPSGTKRIYREHETEYNCKLPDWVYQKYTKKRKEMLNRIIKEMSQEIEEDEKQKLEKMKREA